MQKLKTTAYSLQRWLHQPQKVALFSLYFLILMLIFNGSLFRLWRLNKDLSFINNQMKVVTLQIEKLDLQIKEAKNPNFIERQALDKMDLVGEHDLLFVFPE